jgi:outer membrane immunogenic protein
MKRLLMGIAAVTSLLATSALAADLPAKVYTKAPVYVDPGYNWSGFYIGGNLGYSWGRAATDGTQTGTQSVSEFTGITNVLLPGFPVVTALATTPVTARANVNGVIGGGQAGYNWQRGTWLFGLETDIQGSDERGSADARQC